MNQEYYQIYENNRPLKNHAYPTAKAARMGLKRLHNVISQHGDVIGYTVEKRLSHIPVRNTLGIRRVYLDGSTLHVTYTIQHVKMQPIFTNQF